MRDDFTLAGLDSMLVVKKWDNCRLAECLLRGIEKEVRNVKKVLYITVKVAFFLN